MHLQCITPILGKSLNCLKKCKTHYILPLGRVRYNTSPLSSVHNIYYIYIQFEWHTRSGSHWLTDLVISQWPRVGIELPGQLKNNTIVKVSVWDQVVHVWKLRWHWAPSNPSLLLRISSLLPSSSFSSFSTYPPSSRYADYAPDRHWHCFPIPLYYLLLSCHTICAGVQQQTSECV